MRNKNSSLLMTKESQIECTKQNDKQLPLFQTETAPISQITADEKTPFSQYIVYVDESGDHSLQSIDEQYPIFVLAFCVFHKRHYSETIVPALEKFKFNYFGHDQVVLHENEIRKEKVMPDDPFAQITPLFSG